MHSTRSARPVQSESPRSIRRAWRSADRAGTVHRPELAPPAALSDEDLAAELYALGLASGLAGEPHHGITSPARWYEGYRAGAAARRPAALDWPSTEEIDGFDWVPSPDPADRQHWAECNPDHHFDGPVPDELLDAPLPRLEELLDVAERSGWEGEDLSIPAGLDADEAEQIAAVWADGRRQRARDEESHALDMIERGLVPA